MTTVNVSAFVVGFLLCHSSLGTHQPSLDLWKMALRSGLYLTLTRDEVLNIHKVSEDLFDNMKGYENFRYTQYGPNEPNKLQK